VEQEDAAVDRQRRGKHISATKNKHATIEELFEAVFSMRPLPRLYSEDQQQKQSFKGLGFNTT
jgi:hypothetical protein